MISILNADAVSKAYAIIEATRSQMHQNGIDQWYDNYPSLALIEEDIQSNTLFGYFQDQKLAGIVTLNMVQDDQYADFKWKYNNGKTGVFHRLAVHPDFQGNGIAKQLVTFGEQYFSNYGFTQIRLDAYSSNPSALALYNKLGYEPNGQVWFPNRKKAFWLFEKSLIS